MKEHALHPYQLSMMYHQHKMYNKTHPVTSFRDFCKQEYKGTFTSYHDGTLMFKDESDYTMFLLRFG